MKRLILFTFSLIIIQLGFSRSQVDTISVLASKMNKEIKAVVIKPVDYSKKNHYPVVYLLHGYSDNYAKYIQAIPELKNLATEHQFIVVCPDGGYSSWYFDSPIDSTFQYDSYITNDLLLYVDKHYSTIKDRKARAITGHSMGGHGALYLAIKHKDLFANAGSMSGGVDLRSSTKKYDIAKRIGSIESKSEEWDDRSVVNMVTSLKNNELNLIIDCGVNDFFYQINNALHRRLIVLKIDHDYIERPGSHTWDYWRNSINYQFLYFDRCFQAAKAK